jgi:hypothetical protein
MYFLQPHGNTYTGTITRERWNSPCVSLKAHRIFGFPLCSVATHRDNSTRELLQQNRIFKWRCDFFCVLPHELLCTREKLRICDFCTISIQLLINPFQCKDHIDSKDNTNIDQRYGKIIHIIPYTMAIVAN